jgi:4-aminobutyrate aminotransferase-like enzyme
MTSESDRVRAQHRQYLFGTFNYYEEPVVLAEGKGVRVKDLDGKSYLDFFGGILTISVGHCNDAVNDAVIAQIRRLGHVSTVYPTVPIVALAEKLAAITPGQLSRCFFSTSGTEADECAVMMAQVATGNQEIVALRHGYSGRSMLAQALTAHAPWRPTPTQIAAVKHAPAPYCYRCPLKLEYPRCDVACARDIEELVRTTTTGRIAGMLAEPIQGVGGFITPPREYFEIAATIVRKHGGVFIADEVQTGFGRTGKTWGIEQYGVEPDIMTMAKGVANGLPLGVTICTPAVADALETLTLSTFGGNPISSTAAKATIDFIERQHLVANAAEQGAILRAGLEELRERHPKTIGDVRGMGLMQGVELVVDETTRDRTPHPKAALRLMEETKKRGLLVGKGGLHGNVIRVSPPLVIREEEIDEGLEILGESLAAMGAA